jgi:hypothetical protein
MSIASSGVRFPIARRPERHAIYHAPISINGPQGDSPRPTPCSRPLCLPTMISIPIGRRLRRKPIAGRGAGGTDRPGR